VVGLDRDNLTYLATVGLEIQLLTFPRVSDETLVSWTRAAVLVGADRARRRWPALDIVPPIKLAFDRSIFGTV
jgi:hypothetical protein